MCDDVRDDKQNNVHNKRHIFCILVVVVVIRSWVIKWNSNCKWCRDVTWITCAISPSQTKVEQFKKHTNKIVQFMMWWCIASNVPHYCWEEARCLFTCWRFRDTEEGACALKRLLPLISQVHTQHSTGRRTRWQNSSSSRQTNTAMLKLRAMGWKTVPLIPPAPATTSVHHNTRSHNSSNREEEEEEEALLHLFIWSGTHKRRYTVHTWAPYPPPITSQRTVFTKFPIDLASSSEIRRIKAAHPNQQLPNTFEFLFKYHFASVVLRVTNATGTRNNNIVNKRWEEWTDPKKP